MKKLKYYIFIIMAFFIIPIISNAKTISDNTSCKDVDSSITICEFKFKSTDPIKSINTIKIKLTLENLNIENISLMEDWYLIKNANNEIYIETSKDTLETNFTVATITFRRIKQAENCRVASQFTFGQVKRNCTNFKGNYYDQNGNITSQLTYEKECFPHMCETLSDGTKYGVNGTIVDDITFQKECEKPVCHKYPDHTYSDKLGNIVDKNTYEKECLPHICETLSDGTKYGVNGTVVDDISFTKECEKPVCHKYPDNTYSDKTGNIVDKATYEKECIKKICTIREGKKYGKNGTEVDDITYQKECEINICTILSDGTIYDKDGNITTKETYEIQCKDKNYCKIINHAYFGKNGEEVSELTYQKECLPHMCETLSDGTQYGPNGEMINEEDYIKFCTNQNSESTQNNETTPNINKEDTMDQSNIDNPQTGAFINYVILMISIFVAIGCFIYIRKKNKIRKI